MASQAFQLAVLQGRLMGGCSEALMRALQVTACRDRRTRRAVKCVAPRALSKMADPSLTRKAPQHGQGQSQQGPVTPHDR